MIGFAAMPRNALLALPRLTRAALVALLLLCWGWCVVKAEPLVFYGSSSGAQTLDEGEGGGNPFASAFIEILNAPSVGLGELPGKLARITHHKSGGFQVVDVPGIERNSSWKLVPRVEGEQRIALVLVVSDYVKAHGAQSLPGAKRDAERVTKALHAAGFTTEIVLDGDLPLMKRKLAEFARRSETKDAAIIYTTGHGVEVDGRVFLLPGDYPVPEGSAALSTHALQIADIAKSARARSVSLVFYGGCRDDPFKK